VALRTPDESTLDALLKDMSELKRHLPSMSDWQPPPTLLRAKICKTVFTGLFIGGLLGVFADAAQPYSLVSFQGLMGFTAAYGIGAVLVTLLFIRAAFSGSSYGYDVFRQWLVTGFAGTLLCTNVALFNINIYCDHSPAETFRQRVANRYISYGKHNSVTYHVTVESWRETGKAFPLIAGSQLYYQAVPGRSYVAIATHPGALGFEWIQHYEVIQ
jgi:hypothetical protein